MSELEKMLSGQWYCATDKELVAQRAQAKRLCFDYNQLSGEHKSQRKKILKTLLPNVKGAWIEPQFYCDYGCNIYAPSGVFINHHVTILDGANIHIGKNVLIGPNTVIAATSHHMDAGERAKGMCRSKPITIGSDVWIGANVTILGGVNIEDGAIIPAGSTLR
ncbi:sugar O-acetyltransferase [Glaciecola sp. XM2]|jgi:acetyltransferase-like isoleucine patch superfamily enzyme|uniref:sugar O-acetyltransferase n=1 Tax=Glaciecola sp. XM2 TaxID=1914931 RepID=UPI001BDEF087|nr:sugar O-acetyltransferase [Glaciecola sp. XM2]MBT1449939.1 sugar O-acetyltransferase [Glaciecola sp. XM2]